MRSTKFVVLEDRGEIKTYFLTEMSSERSEAWALRAIGGMVRSGQPMPEEALGAGWPTVAMLGLRALMAVPWEELAPLMAEMMGCVQIKPGSTDLVRPLVETDIEDVATRARLREEVFSLHAGFSLAATLSGIMAAKTAAEMDPTSPDTQTSLNL